MSNQKTKKPLLWIILTAVFAVLMVAVIVGNSIAADYESLINMALGIDPVTVVKARGDDNEYEYFATEYQSAEDLLEDDKYWAEVLTEEGAVLLKNQNGALPLAKNAKVSIFGHSSVNMLVCGTGSADIDATGAHDLKYTLEENGVDVNDDLWNFYVDNIEKYPTVPKKGDQSIRSGDGSIDYYLVNEIPWKDISTKGDIETYDDAAIMVVSRLGGEMYDIPAKAAEFEGDKINKGNSEETATGNMLELTHNELDVLENLNKNFDKVIVLVNSCNAMEYDFIDNEKYGVDACLWIGYTGLMGLDGVADLLTGDANPSGRIVDTFCVDNLTSPAMVNFYGGTWSNVNDYMDLSGQGGGELDSNKFYNVYQEGIYVGYRYYETRYEDSVFGRAGVGEYDYSKDVKYPFGYGLSYSTFEQELAEAKESTDGKSFEFKVKVTNTGNVAGKEVVQIYFQSPYTQYDIDNGIEKAAIELCGFAKAPVAADTSKAELTKLLAPNDGQAGGDDECVVTITVDKKELRAYDANNAKTYVMDAGDYYFAVGHNAHDALNNVIALKDAEDASVTADASKIFIADNNTAGDAALAWKWNNPTLDTNTFSVSNEGEANYAITNQFDDADLNKLTAEQTDNQTVQYLSRNNWTNTWPQKLEIKLSQYLHDNLTGIKKYSDVKDSIDTTGMTLPETGDPNSTVLQDLAGADYDDPRWGQKGTLTLAQLIGKDFDDPMWEDLLDQVTFEEMCQLIGVGYHSTMSMYSIAKPQTIDENGPQGFTKKLTDITGEGGKSCAYTDENIMAATWNVELMQRIGEQLGEDIRWAGGTGLYGPAMNTHRTPYSGRNFEYYSEDGFLAGKIAAAESYGIESKGCYVYVKHFALNDQETNCRCLSVFANEQTIREVYLEPFEHAIVDGGASNVMNSFSRVGVTWSGAHAGLSTNVLRKEWGMKGFAVTDYSTSGTTYQVRLGLLAGTDTWDCSSYGAWGKELERTAKTDVIMLNAMRDATHRILYTVANSAAMNGIGPHDVLEPTTPWWKNAVVVAIVALAVLTVASAGMTAWGFIKGKKANKAE
ncbi:MAG: glycoside hydrolase family 3 protein [Clostridia bacterium]|nr:glycoside hydrolase family 3 protein [Clostridia bacterium]